MNTSHAIKTYVHKIELKLLIR